MDVGKKPIGTKRACEVMLDMLANDYPNIDMDNIMITHAIAPESLEYLEKRVKEIVDPSLVNINITHAGCVISSHCGEGTIGILYIKK